MDSFRAAADAFEPERAVAAGAPRVLSVSALSQQIKGVLEETFPAVWVGGEISDFSRPSSGHIYFTLKDSEAQIRAVMWRSAAARLRCELENGMEVVCQGEITVYPPRGNYQLSVRQLEPRGMGALERELRRLREKLAAEGLFDRERKRPMPRFPRQIAFVTSPTGAAVRDYLEIARRRWSGANILIIPARVQGEGSAAEIVRGIEMANKLRPPPDILVVGRGGGSMEDLWSFNHEAVVRAIHASRVPVVSAVGHDIDVTLADLAADLRAATPSEAAERTIPAADEIRAALAAAAERLRMRLRQKMRQLRERLNHFAERRALRRPYDRLRDTAERLDELESRGKRAALRSLQRERTRLDALRGRLSALNPHEVLARGYSITLRAESGAVVTRAEEIAPGDRVITRVAHGEFTSRVE